MSDDIKIYIDQNLMESFSELISGWGGLVEQQDLATHLFVGEASKDLIESAKEKSQDLILVSDEDFPTEFIENGSVQAVIRTFQLHSPVVQKFLLANVIRKEGLHISEFTLENKVETIRVMDNLSTGYCTDILTTDAFEVNVDSFQIRHFFTEFFNFIGEHSKNNQAHFPFSIEYCAKDEVFFCQASIDVEDFTPSFFKGKSCGGEDVHYLEVFTKFCDFVDIQFLNKYKKIAFSFLWLGEKASSQKTGSLIFGQVPSYLSESTFREQENLKVSKSETTSSDSQDKASSDKLIRIKRFVAFAFDQTDLPENFDREELDRVLSEFPDKSLVKKLSEDELDKIVECVRDQSSYDQLESDFKQIVSGVDEDEFVQKVKSTVEEVGFDEISEIISGQKEDLGEENIRISGQREDITPEVWEIKKLELAKKVEEDLSDYNDLDEEGKEEFKRKVEKEVQNFLEEEVGFLGHDAQGIAFHIIDDALIDMNNDFDEGLEAIEQIETGNLNSKKEIVGLRQELEKVKNEKERADVNNKRVMKLVESMKGQIQKMYEVDQEMAEVDFDQESPDQEIDHEKRALFLQRELIKAREKIANKDSVIEKVREANEKRLEQKEKEIEKLNDKLSEMNHEHLSDPNSESPKVKISRLEQENETLANQLENAQERMAQLNENFSARMKSSMEKAQQEITKLKSQIGKQNQVLQTIKSERDDLQRQLRQKSEELEDKRKKLEAQVESSEGEGKSEDNSNLDDIKEYEKRIKELEGAIRSHESQEKAASLKFKQYEQKVKFLNAQLESALKSAPGHGENGGIGAGASKAELPAEVKHKMKQLEVANERYEKALKKTSDDLTKKKKEVIKLTHQVNGLSAKLQAIQSKTNIKSAS